MASCLGFSLKNRGERPVSPLGKAPEKQKKKGQQSQRASRDAAQPKPND